jgi:hypothetical protein
LPMDACVRVDACRVLHNSDIAKGSWVDAYEVLHKGSRFSVY